MGRGGQKASHRAVVRALWRRPSTADAAQNLERLREAREIADYVRDSAHTEAQAIFSLNGVSDWRELAQASLVRARDVFAALQRLPPEA